MFESCLQQCNAGAYTTFEKWGGLASTGLPETICRWVRPSLMLVVKVLIFYACEACAKFWTFSSQVALFLHFSFKLGVTITLLPYLARNLKFDKILRKYLPFFVLLWAREPSVHCAGWRLGYIQQHSKFNWTILHVHKNRTDNLPMCSVANEFVAHNDSRIRILGHLSFNYCM